MLKIDNDGKWKNNIRMKNANKDYDGAKKDLRMIRFSLDYGELNFDDKFFVDYCLAHLFYREKNLELAKEYLDDLKYLFDNEACIDAHKDSYCKYLWLKVNNCKNEMDNYTILKNMQFVCDYYKEIKHSTMYYIAKGNMYYQVRDSNGLLECFKECLKDENKIEFSIINSFLENLKEIDEKLYIIGYNLLEDYKRENNRAN